MLHIVLHGKGPQRLIRTFVWPVNRCVNHHGTCPFRDSLDRVLCVSVLRVCPYSREVILLIMDITMVRESFGDKDAIFSVMR